MAGKVGAGKEYQVQVPVDNVSLNGDLWLTENAQGIVVFAHGSGSGRLSPRNRFVARSLTEAGLSTLLFDLLTTDEEAEDTLTGELRFNISFLTERLIQVTDWLAQDERATNLKIGYFGASTGAAAALTAASERPDTISAIVSRGGRPDLAMDALPYVKAPTLLIVGGLDAPVIEMNRAALARLTVKKDLIIVPEATHLFEEPGKLEEVARLAVSWFKTYLR